LRRMNNSWCSAIQKQECQEPGVNGERVVNPARHVYAQAIYLSSTQHLGDKLVRWVSISDVGIVLPGDGPCVPLSISTNLQTICHHYCSSYVFQLVILLGRPLLSRIAKNPTARKSQEAWLHVLDTNRAENRGLPFFSPLKR